MKNQVKCPTCRKMTLWQTENRYRPFCCERCKLIDLGEWANESHVITTELSPDQIDVLVDTLELN